MDCQRLLLAALVSLLLGPVAHAQTEPGLPFDPSRPSGEVQVPLTPPVQPPPMTEWNPETEEWEDNRPDLLDFQLGKGVGLIAHYLMRFVMWLTAPICLLLEIFFGWLGFTGASPFINFNAGTVGYLLGLVDSWFPLHELIFHAFALWGCYIMWAPFRLLVKYLFPGLG